MQTTIKQMKKKQHRTDTVCSVSIVSNGQNGTQLEKERYEFKMEKSMNQITGIRRLLGNFHAADEKL